MKNKNIIIAAVAVIALAGISFSYYTNQNECLSDIQLANIEALTTGEIVVDQIPCYSAYLTEPLEHFVYCLRCVDQTGHPYGETGKCSSPVVIP